MLERHHRLRAPPLPLPEGQGTGSHHITSSESPSKGTLFSSESHSPPILFSPPSVHPPQHPKRSAHNAMCSCKYAANEEEDTRLCFVLLSIISSRRCHCGNSHQYITLKRHPQHWGVHCQQHQENGPAESASFRRQPRDSEEDRSAEMISFKKW